MWSDGKRMKSSGFIWTLSDFRRQALVFFGAPERVVGMLTVSIDLPRFDITCSSWSLGAGARVVTAEGDPSGSPHVAVETKGLYAIPYFFVDGERVFESASRLVILSRASRSSGGCCRMVRGFIAVHTVLEEQVLVLFGARRGVAQAHVVCT